MEEKRTKFLVGLFVILGFMLALAIVVWLGASHYFRTSYKYETFFDESVQGLAMDASVKFRGVDVGRVHAIKIAPDYKLIEVIMDLYRKDIVTKDTFAQIGTIGFTGTDFVNLVPRKPEEKALSPKITFQTKYPVIPSIPSEMDQIMSAAKDAASGLKGLNLQGISNRIELTLKKVEQLVSNPKLNKTVDNMESATARLDAITVSMQNAIDAGNLKEALVSARQAMTETRALARNARTQVDRIRLDEIAARASRLIEELEKTSRLTDREIRAVGENLRTAAENLELLLQNLNNNPSQLIFGKQRSPRR